MKKIKATKGQFALVDDEDFGYLNRVCWYYCEGYAVRKFGVSDVSYLREKYGDTQVLVYVPRINIMQKHITMSRLVLGLLPWDSREVDHKDRNKLNNQKLNLRVCLPKENQRNIGPLSNNISGYKGVCYVKTGKRLKRWRVDVNREHIGHFHTVTEAAKVYNTKAKERYGEFAYQNPV